MNCPYIVCVVPTHDEMEYLSGDENNNIPHTNPHPLVSEWTQILNMNFLSNLLKRMHEEHAHLKTNNKLEMFEKTFPGLIKSRDIQLLNEPTFEAMVLLQQCPEITPKAHNKIFMTTATANSGNDPAFYNAFEICGYLQNLIITKTSTGLTSGCTGVSHVRCRNAPVNYDQSVPKKDWSLESDKLFQELMKKNEGDTPYDIIYHWGCISQQWIEAPWGNMTSSWLYHEDWNWVYTIAMMRHSIQSLKQGGVLVLKCRIFKKAQSMGLLAMLSTAFEVSRIVTNPRCTSTFVTFIGTKFRGIRHEKVQILQNDLRRCTDYALSSIFTCDSFGFGSAFLSQCEKAHTDMLTRESIIYTVWLFAMHILREALLNNDNSESSNRDYTSFDKYLNKVYNGKTEFIAYLKNNVHNCYSTLQNNAELRNIFLRVMQSKWMKASC